MNVRVFRASDVPFSTSSVRNVTSVTISRFAPRCSKRDAVDDDLAQENVTGRVHQRLEGGRRDDGGADEAAANRRAQIKSPAMRTRDRMVIETA